MQKEVKLDRIPEHENLDYNEILLPSYYEWLEKQPESYKSYRISWASGNKLPENIPLHLDIEPTNMCNLKCTMCPRTELVNSGEFWDLGYFPIEKYKDLIREFSEKGGASIKFNYLGEPLLSREIYEMIEIASKQGLVDIMLNTNGTLLDEEAFTKLTEAGLTKLFISFDGANAETYNQIRIGANFDKVLANILPLKSIRASLKSINPLIRVSCTIVDDNILKQKNDFVKMFTPYVDAIGFGEITHGWDNQSQNIKDLLHEAKDKKNEFICPDAQKRMFVHPDSVVTACCYDSKRKIIYGNINESSLSEIWNGQQRFSLISKHQKLDVADLEPCNSCMYLFEHLKPGSFH